MLDELLGSTVRAKVLGWLFSHPDERYYVRQLESLLGCDATNISRELTKLAAMGILSSRTEGRQKYYQANRDCPIYPELRGLAIKTAGLADELRKALRDLGGRILAACVYGSLARGEVNSTSDVDVLVVGEASFAEVVSALGPAQDKVGREINPTVYPVEEFRQKLAEGHHFLQSVMAGPKLFLIGGESELEGLAK
jgi:predicted nucleotidyltransferase